MIIRDLRAAIDATHKLSDVHKQQLPSDERRKWLRALREAEAKETALHRQAIELFGKLNGWTRSERSFTPEAIGRPHTSWNYHAPGLGTGWMDHAVHYRARRPGWKTARNVAIVGQPYDDGHQHRQELDACAAQYGLRWHMPPLPFVSFHYPGHTLFVVMTLPEIEVRWLPEQLEHNENLQ